MAIANSDADVCLLCDDDEVFVEGYEEKILETFAKLPQADVIIFRMVNYPCSLGDQVRRLKFPRPCTWHPGRSHSAGRIC